MHSFGRHWRKIQVDRQVCLGAISHVTAKTAPATKDFRRGGARGCEARFLLHLQPVGLPVPLRFAQLSRLLDPTLGGTGRGRPGVTGPTVVVIDDDEEVRHALRLLFELDGFSVVGEATNGVAGLALARRHQPDFVILDPVMPRLGGNGTAAILRAVAPSSKIVAFAAALRARPEWADAFLIEDRVGEVAPLLTAVIPRRGRLAS